MNIPGTPFNDRLTGTAENDIINREGDPLGFPGTRGDDELFGAGGNDVIYGGPDNDVLAGMSGDDLLYGGSGDDEFQGGTGNDQIYGEDGNDLLRGFTGDDLLRGGSGNDELSADIGNDLLDGGFGTDTASYSVARAGVIVNLSLAGAQNTVGLGVDTILNIENLTGSDFTDTLTGNGANNVLLGLNGNDQLDGGSGSDLLDGGLGTDTASYSTAIAGVIVNLSLAAAQNTVGAGVDTILDIENISGSSFQDTLTGNGANNVLSGLNGNDRLLGGNGIDSLFGGLGHDRLDGGTGNDEIIGGDGSDLLNGGGGADTQTGGLGADTFLLRGTIESQPGIFNRDVITDFAGAGAALSDQISLGEIDANLLVTGNQAFKWIGGSAFSAFNAAGQLRYAGGVLQGSTDADTAAEFEIQLLGAPALFVSAGHPGSDILL